MPSPSAPPDAPCLPEGLRAKIARVRLAVFDVDGTLTDGGIIFNTNGGDVKRFHAQDGLGLKLLRESGVKIAWISARCSSIVERRAEELGIQHLIQGSAGKGLELERLQAQLRVEPDETAAMGDDLPDLALFSRSGVTFAPADAVEDIRAAADWISSRVSGDGAARQVCELILKVQGKWDHIIAKFASQ